MPKVSCLGEWRPRCVSTQMATILQQMLLNYSNIQTVALVCILLSIIICIFTWHRSRGSNAHSQQQTAFIYSQTYVLSPTDSFWGKVLIKLNSNVRLLLIWLSRGSAWLPAHPVPSPHPVPASTSTPVIMVPGTSSQSPTINERS